MLAIAKRMYEASPEALRALIWRAPQPFQLAPGYVKTRSALRKLAAMSSDEAAQSQKMLLAGALIWALETVPFYSHELGGVLNREDIKEDPFGCLAQFPVIDKNTLRAHSSELISTRVPQRRRYLATTGGSTGAPLEIWLSNNVWAREWAFVYDLLSKHGVSEGDVRVSLRGVRRLGAKPGMMENNPVYKEIRVSPFHLTASSIDELSQMFVRRKPVFIHGYPSAVRDLLALLGDRARQVLSSVKLVLLVSENLPYSEIVNIESSIDAKVLSFYGHSERACFAEWVPAYGEWRPNSLYGVVEILGARIVATGFINKAMPLVRYDTGDMVGGYRDHGVVGVGDGFRSIEGRWTHDFLVGKSGQRITMTALNTHIPEMRSVRKFQFVQGEVGKATLRVVMGATENAASVVSAVLNEFNEKCQGELIFNVQVVDDIPLSRLGKHAFIIREGAVADERS